ncbi:hypothetical protein [Streptomyces yangpuensis]|uniref:hypothetical protein n=1 Tax=Streptomyces yangpuensis TaxID=1648182 RepID=UPI000A9B2335|nr:hypothetical protein [Streptomyces yangpuensis]
MTIIGRKATTRADRVPAVSHHRHHRGLKSDETGMYGEYRTRRLVLTPYERMAAAG